ncbi:hypothetical protein OG292_17475 [Streptomyces sp. NBC_01511]|uniref:hypothetical protein n=1 Tax=Streptomyces sp. NBC_01511 TaxID=2903889 RepID=UPI00386F13C3
MPDRAAHPHHPAHHGGRHGPGADPRLVEHTTLHVLPVEPLALGLGEERLVGSDRTISFNSVRYSTPPGCTGAKVWCRVVGEELSITGRTNSGDLSEIWRHQPSTPGVPQIIDEHYPDHPDGHGIHQPRLRPRPEAEIAFVGIGPGAGRRRKEAGPAGATRIRAKMARAVELATGLGNDRVDQAPGLAATAGRFADDDLVSVLGHIADSKPAGEVVRAGEAPLRPERNHRLAGPESVGNGSWAVEAHRSSIGVSHR